MPDTPPLSAGPRSKDLPPGRVDLHFRPTREEYGFLQRKARENGESISSYLRRLLHRVMAAERSNGRL
jgi:hypothetical protein